ncbi:alpha/beta fold hydrolase [Paenibacillus psychroresistens]|uniref:Alpha/beta fold hydrolase n=1 Tax=Paenibacillus psychroresistens TaxID=1778678 RepID=A0A6B8RAR1_9BACL|nr:alpha/beta fold hydrolase [Paenibacillus psychroresistens]QGQ93450.1 alpha/beta fold hydrolase [Paenibacillus psychroresistens]
MAKNTIEFNGIVLAYEDQGSGEPLVLLHGLCGSSDYWDKILPQLSKQYRVIAPDLRGHGQSGISDEPYPMELMAHDIAELLEKLHIPQAILIGHSLGGYVTLAFAEQYPEKLHAFSLVHSSGFADDEKGKANRDNGIAGISENGIESFIAGLNPKLFAPEHLETMKPTVEHIRQIGVATNPKGAMNVLVGMRDRVDRNQIIADAQVPVLLIAGEADQIIPLEKAFAEHGEHITQVTIANAGHMSMQEQPAALLEQILTFADRIYNK